MKQSRSCLTVRAERQGLVEITGEIAAWLAGQEVGDGLLTVFIRHTSASLLIQENVDSDVQRDLESFLKKARARVRHRLSARRRRAGRHAGPHQGRADPEHLSIPVGAGRLLLGRYQGIFLFEHRRSPRPREIVLHFMERSRRRPETETSFHPKAPIRRLHQPIARPVRRGSRRAVEPPALAIGRDGADAGRLERQVGQPLHLVAHRGQERLA